MEQVKQALEEYAGDNRAEKSPPEHPFRVAAQNWALWCVQNTKGARLMLGLALVKGLCDYADLDESGEREEAK